MFKHKNTFTLLIFLLVIELLVEKKNAVVVVVSALSFRRNRNTDTTASSVLQVPMTCLVDGYANDSSSSSSSSSRGEDGYALILDASCRLVSESLPRDVTKRELVHFLQQPNVRNLFFSAGGTRPVVSYQMTNDIQTLWQNVVQCQYFSCPSSPISSSSSYRSLLLPQHGDTIMSCESVVHMFGLTITTTALNGIKMFHSHHYHSPFHFHHHDNNDDSSPIYYMLVGVAERQDVIGSRPMVWLYNQVTGLHKRKKNVFYPTPARACSKISITTTTTSATDTDNDGDNDCNNNNNRRSPLLALEYCIQLKIIVHIPKVLVRLLPTSKPSLERQASAAIIKALSKDVQATLNHVRQEFLQQRVK